MCGGSETVASLASAACINIHIVSYYHRQPAAWHPEETLIGLVNGARLSADINHPGNVGLQHLAAAVVASAVAAIAAGQLGLRRLALAAAMSSAAWRLYLNVWPSAICPHRLQCQSRR